MKKSFLYLLVFVIILLTIVGVIQKTNIFSKKNMIFQGEKRNLKGYKIAQIVAFRDFRDEEYFIPHNIFLGAGALVKTYSTSLGTAIGSSGGEAKIDGTIDNLNVSDFDAVVFSGGAGCLKYLDNETSYKIVREAVDQNKILGSICISPVILAKAGILEGKRATVWSSVMDKSPIKILKKHGAEFVDKPVVVDGNIITGNGPGAAKEFAETIANFLTKK